MLKHLIPASLFFVLILAGCSSAPSHPIYRGEVLNGIPHGTGKKYFPDGSKYEGQWQNGQYSGEGILTWADKVSRYIGQFANGQRNGKGRMTYADGSTYDGDWKNDKRHGHGLLILADGNRYDSDWQDDAAQGFGKQQLSNDNFYQGNFSRGVRSGDGAAVVFHDPETNNWCLENCSASPRFAVISGVFANGTVQSPTVAPCGSDREKCKAMLPAALAAIARERERKLAEAEAERKRKEAEAERERKRKEAEALAEQKRKEAERLALLNEGSAAQVYTYADKLEADKDYTQAAEAYRIVVNRFPDSAFAAAAMTRLGVMRDKREQQEAEQKRIAREDEIRKADEQRRQQEAAARKAEREHDAAQRQADRDAAATAQQRSTTGAACVEAAKALCDQQFSGLANIACKAAAGAGCN